MLAAAIHLALAGGLLAAWQPEAHAQAGGAQSPAAVRAYDIPAGPLDAALTRFVAESGVPLATTPELVQGKQSPGLHGAYAVQAAFNVLLAGTGLQAVVGKGGSYVLRQTPVDISGGGVTTLPAIAITGSAAENDLPPTYAGGQLARGGRLGMLGNADILDAPFNQTSYTSELIESQQAATLGDLLDNDPSVRRSSEASGSAEFFRVRGFDVNTSETAVNGLYGLAPTYGGFPVDFVERVEVLKGPSALLNGMSPNGQVGGAINIVPKRASADPLTRLTVGIDSDSLWKTHLDLGRRFGENGEWGVRVNAGYKNGSTYIDGQSKRSNEGAIALDYRGDRVRFALDAYHFEDDISGGNATRVGVSGSGLASMPQAPDGSTNVSPGADFHTKTDAATLSGDVDITDNWTAFAKIGRMYAKHRGDFFSQALNLQANGDATLSQVKYPQNIQTTTGEAGIRGKFNTGRIKHAFVLSGSRLESTNSFAISFLGGQKTNIYAPGAIAQWPADPGDPVKSAKYILSSIAVADTLSALEDRVLLTLGVRRQTVKQTDFNDGVGSTAYDQSAWTPMVGLVVKPIDSFSLYANVIQGLSQGQTVGADYLNVNEVFPPYKSKQIELGAKWDTGNLTNTLSVFQIRQPSTLADYSTSPLPTLRLNGEQRNRGIEWTVFGTVGRGVRILGGVTYIQARLTKTQDGAQDGNEAPGVAPWATNLGIEWDTPWAQGLTLSGRIINTSSQYIDNANTIKLPSWTRVDIGARYATRISGNNIVFRAGVRNVFNKNYWEGVPASGLATVGAPRTFMLSATMDF